MRRTGKWGKGEAGKRVLFRLLLLSTLSFSPFRLLPLCPFPCGTAVARDYPPAVPPPKSYVVAPPAVRRLDNGLKVVLVERHSLPLITAYLVVKAGAEADPPDLPGTAQFVASLLSQGTQRRTAQQIAEAIDDAGGTIDTGADWDKSFASISVLTDHTELAFDLLADMVVQPAFASAEVERARKRTLSALEVLRGDPSYLADAVFDRLVFAGTHYSHPADGTREALKRMTVESLRTFHARYYQPANSILIIVGDVVEEQVLNLAGRYFGSWNRMRGEPPEVPRSEIANFHRREVVVKREVVVIDKPDAVQTEIRVGNLAVGRESPDYDALAAANQILGGPAANRLFSALRSQHGLTYGASSELRAFRGLGSWVAKTSTRTFETVKAVHMILEQRKRLRDRAPLSLELTNTQSYLIGHVALDFETPDGIAAQTVELMAYDLPLDYWPRFPEKVRDLTERELWDTTRRYLDPEGIVIVLVGNSRAFKKGLKKLGHVRIIPMDKLDLESANLVANRS
jgi:zinc protease